MLAEGRGGLVDYGKYRQTLTDIVWRGVTPGSTTGSAEAVPESALDEARAMYEASKQRLAAEKN